MVLEPSLFVPLFRALMSCQVYEKASIQKLVGNIADNCLIHLFEPSFLIYTLDIPSMDAAASNLENTLPRDLVDDALLEKGRKNREQRIKLYNSCIEELVSSKNPVVQLG